MSFVVIQCPTAQQITDVNHVVRTGLERGLPIGSIMENWDFLQV
jgi:hypothetical protein